MDLDWEHEGELLVALWAHDQGMDLTIKVTTQITQEYETCQNQVIRMNKVSLEQRVVARITPW